MGKKADHLLGWGVGSTHLTTYSKVQHFVLSNSHIFITFISATHLAT